MFADLLRAVLAPARLAVLLVVAGLALSPARACPFCAPSPLRPSLQEELASHPIAAVVKPIGTVPRSTRVEVVAAVQGSATVGERLEYAGRRRFERRGTYLALYGEEGEPVRRVLELTAPARAYLDRLVALPAVDPERPETRGARLRLALEHLGDPDEIVTIAVLYAFSQAPYEALVALRDELDANDLVERLWAPGTPVGQRGVLFLLLAIEGSEAARKELRGLWGWPQTRMQPGVDGLMGALILVDGAKGLDAVVAARPDESAASSDKRWYAQNLLQAVDFHLRYEDVVPRDDLFAVIHRYLEDGPTAGQAIVALMRLEHWESLERVATARELFAEERGSVERASRSFFMKCPGEEAKALLEAIERR